MARAVHLMVCAAFLFIAALVLTTGCIEEPAKNTTPAPGPAILVDYSRTGGIAGVEDHLVIFENGAGVYSGQRGRGAFFLNQTILDEINDEFYRVGFLSMNASYPAPSPGADYFTYTITYHNHTVNAEDTGVPPALQPVIQRLNEIIAERANNPVYS